MKPATTAARPVLGLAKGALFTLIFSLALMKLTVPIGDYGSTATDGLFLITGALWALAMWRGETHARWNGFFVLLAVYFIALALSALSSGDLRATAIKLLTQVYLLALPVLIFNLVDSADELKRALLAWLAGSAVPAVVGTATVALFYLGADRQWLAGSVGPYGLLPPGPYPRLTTTFFYPSMLCNYLTVSVFILFAARQRGWLDRRIAYPLLAATIVTAAFTVTPGLGGFVLALGAWIYWSRFQRPVRIIALTVGIAAAAASVPISTLTPIIHPTAPYLVTVPGAGWVLAPSVRLMTWTAATNLWLAHPLFGAGIGATPMAVRFVDPSGILHVLADAHNVYLNIAAQCGTVGLAAVLLLIWRVARDTSRVPRAMPTPLALVLGIAWLDAFAIQGFTSAFEDARHLWVLLGLWLVSLDVEGAKSARSGAMRVRRASTENNRSRE